MVDDGTLLLLHEGVPLSVQAARALLIGRADSTGRAAALQLRLSVFTSLHRNGYVCRIRAPHTAAAPVDEPDLIAAYERRGFTRRAVDKENAPPAFIVACHRADQPLPGADVLYSLAQQCAPAPLRCACVQQDEVVFFNIATDIQRPTSTAEEVAVQTAEQGTAVHTAGPAASVARPTSTAEEGTTVQTAEQGAVQTAEEGAIHAAGPVAEADEVDARVPVPSRGGQEDGAAAGVPGSEVTTSGAAASEAGAHSPPDCPPPPVCRKRKTL